VSAATITDTETAQTVAANGHVEVAALALGERSQPRLSGRVGVVLADPDPIYLDGLEGIVRSWPEFELRERAEHPQVLERLQELNAQVLVVDHTTIGIERSELLERGGQSARVLLMCTSPAPADVYTALAEGASGFLAKGCSKQEVCHAIAALGRGREIIGASVQPAVASEIRLRSLAPGDILSAREREILLLMCEGLRGPDIAERLCLGLTTVKSHQHSMYEKLEATDRAMAVARAFRRHVIE